jgi:hypothetical protein
MVVFLRVRAKMEAGIIDDGVGGVNGFGWRGRGANDAQFAPAQLFTH